MNDELKVYFQRIVDATNALCGTNFKKFVPKDVHDALLNRAGFGFTRDHPPTTFGGYMVGIAVCARYIGGESDYMTGKSGLAKICEYLENPTTVFEGECPYCGRTLRWTENDIGMFECPYCGGEYIINGDEEIVPTGPTGEACECDICMAEFSSESELTDHMNDAHWECPYCGEWFDVHDEEHEYWCREEAANS